MTRSLPPLLCLTAALAVGGCDCACGWRACGEPPLATLQARDGEVTRDHAASLHQWVDAPVGAELFLGDGLRTATAARAQVLLDDGSGLRLEEETTIRFSAEPPAAGEAAFEVEAGSATLDVGEAAMRLRTRFGLAVLEAGSVVRMTPGDDGVRFAVEMGVAEFLDASGASHTVQAGSAIEVAMGTAILLDDAEAPPTAARAPSPSAGPAAPEADPGDAEGGVVLEVGPAAGRLRGPDDAEWSALAQGERTVAAGTAIDQRAGGSVTLRHGTRSGVVSGAGLLVVGSEGALARVESGRPRVEARDSDFVVVTEHGSITARALGGGTVSAAELEVTEGGTQVTVVSGEVEVRRGESVETLRAGQAIALGAAGGSGALEVAGRGPARADMTVAAGSSFTVYDPAPPSAVGFDLAEHCPRGGVVELVQGGRVRSASAGEGQVNIAMPAGRHEYRVRCVGEAGRLETRAARRGSATILHNAGTRRLPTSAPESHVDADGRTYTVLYQNRLPRLTVRWPNAPSARAYELRVTRGSRTVHTERSSRATVTLPPGVLREGAHQVRFQVADGGRGASRASTVVVGFDNAAPASSVDRPADGSFTAGQTVSVSGIALPGYSVSVQGVELPLDGHQRFSGQVRVPETNAIALRVTRPGRGVAYFIRRGSGAR